MAVPRILIVDDEPSILSLLRLVLEGENYEVDTAASAADAARKLDEQSFQLVITDIRMETPTAGFEVVRAARRVAGDVPVALLTAFPVPTNDWKQAGADTLFMKGMDSTFKMLEWIQGALAGAKPKAEEHSSVQAAKKRAG
jgi:CheY-like chemotaxis protein